MTTTISLNKRDTFSIAGDLDDIQDYLRVTQEMVIDQLMDYCSSEPGAALKMQERILVLVNQMPAKLTEMNELVCELLEVSKAPMHLAVPSDTRYTGICGN